MNGASERTLEEGGSAFRKRNFNLLHVGYRWEMLVLSEATHVRICAPILIGPRQFNPCQSIYLLVTSAANECAAEFHWNLTLLSGRIRLIFLNVVVCMLTYISSKLF